MKLSTKVAIVQRRLRRERNLLFELKELAKAAGYDVVLELEQVRKPDSRYQIGYGKAKELAELVKEKGIEKVIFFNELKPVQIHNLSKLLGVDVIDRITLILEIFARRAGSKEAKLQIELAMLKKQLSYLKEQLHLAKLGELPGYLGGGEYIIDSYREHVARRITKIKRELEKIRARKNIYWRRRSLAEVPTIVLT
ncbi:MAG: GTP-binding protein HflX, partial [Thermoprotei archaeon]